MKTPDIIEVALKVVRVFEELHIAYHVGGSLASGKKYLGRHLSKTLFCHPGRYRS